MSWSAKVPDGISMKKQDADAVIDAMYCEYADGPMSDQLALAKKAAKELAKGIPGPRIFVALSGHANGVGWQPKSGYANDTITVTVSQHTE